MGFDTVIINGEIVTATESCRVDIGISGEVVAAIAPSLPREGARVLDARGKYVFPGGVDVHTHLDMPLGNITTADDFESGTCAAAFGGTTTIIDFAVQSRGESLHDAIATWKKKAGSKAVVDYGFHCIIADLPDARLEEIPELVREGITSFKVFMAYPGRLMLEDATILKLLRAATRTGAFVCIHAESGPAIDARVKEALAAGHTTPKYHALTRPPSTEAEAVERAIALAEAAGAPLYLVHLTCAEALQRVREARKRGLPIFAETCPQYLFLSIENFDVPGLEGAKYVLTPPLRDKHNQDSLWDGLRSGTLQAVSTDHCGFNFHGQKELHDFTKIPNGGPGIEDRLTLLYTGGVIAGRFSVNRFVELVSTAPARLFGLYPRKGTIAVGSDADLVIFDPARKHTIRARTHHMRVDYNLYEGMAVTGRPEVVLSRGRVIVEGDEFRGRPGAGRFLKRNPFSLD